MKEEAIVVHAVVSAELYRHNQLERMSNQTAALELRRRR
jgi:hypothetical protein